MPLEHVGIVIPTTVRARDLGIPFCGAPAVWNAITDVPGLEVGYSTLWSGSGPLRVGEGPVRTGVSAILPRGKSDMRPCFGGAFALNAAGEMTGLAWLEERGFCEGPILITSTHSVGIVRDSAIQWMRKQKWPFDWVTPIVGETYDGLFNDIDRGHIRAQHVFDALDSAQSGPVSEGNVGGGTGMMTYEYKGGTGTSSRRLSESDGGYTVGILVQSNYGLRRQLRIGGVLMGESLADDLPCFASPETLSEELRIRYPSWCPVDGSIIVIVATDAPLLPHQLKRLAKRPALAIGRLGGAGNATSGDIFLSLSTANADATECKGQFSAPSNIKMHPNLAMTALFEATIDATEEAILNALVAGETAEGANGLRVPRLPHSRVQEELRTHSLLKGGF